MDEEVGCVVNRDLDHRRKKDWADYKRKATSWMRYFLEYPDLATSWRHDTKNDGVRVFCGDVLPLPEI
jgi:hypothetical protein